jgi:hypothetical protein
MQGRQELKTLLEFLRKGDTLVVTRVDRLARSVAPIPTSRPTWLSTIFVSGNAPARFATSSSCG